MIDLLSKDFSTYIANTIEAWTKVNASTGSSGIDIVHSMVHNLGLPITSGLALIISISDGGAVNNNLVKKVLCKYEETFKDKIANAH